MTKVIIGCDPDSSKSGIAVYVDGELAGLKSMTLMEVVDCFNEMDARYGVNSIELHIENLKGVNAAFTGANAKQPQAVKMKMAQYVGMCKQVQTEIERIAEHFGIKVVHHKISKQWKDAKTGKQLFQRATGWEGKSNEDTRSAAYFGFWGVEGD